MPAPVCCRCVLEMTHQNTKRVVFNKKKHRLIWHGELYSCSCGNSVVAAFSGTGQKEQSDSEQNHIEILETR